jgi:hypothetical protein
MSVRGLADLHFYTPCLASDNRQSRLFGSFPKRICLCRFTRNISAGDSHRTSQSSFFESKCFPVSDLNRKRRVLFRSFRNSLRATMEFQSAANRRRNLEGIAEILPSLCHHAISPTKTARREPLVSDLSSRGSDLAVSFIDGKLKRYYEHRRAKDRRPKRSTQRNPES